MWRVVVCDHEKLVDEEAIARDGLQEAIARDGLQSHRRS
jgi:hypothetical protein